MSQQEVPARGNLLGQFVRDRRIAGGLTQEELGQLAGVGKRFIVELERGKPTIRLDKANQVLQVFGKQLGVVGAPRDPASADEVTHDHER